MSDSLEKMETSDGSIKEGEGATDAAPQTADSGSSKENTSDDAKTQDPNPPTKASETTQQESLTASESTTMNSSTISTNPSSDEANKETINQKESSSSEALNSSTQSSTDKVGTTEEAPSLDKDNDDPMEEDDDQDEIANENENTNSNNNVNDGEAAEEDILASDSDQDNMSIDDEEEDASLPKDEPPPTLQRTSFRKRKRRRGNKLFQDCIRIEIPLDYTADLTQALRHTRNKRIRAIHQAFPMLQTRKTTKESAQQQQPAVDDDNGDDDNQSSGKEGSPGSKSKSQRHPHSNGTDRQNYSSILDYLEAKYVKGVMIEDPTEEDGNAPEDDADERGSVYSESSFLDDTDLQRDVAEQVLAHSTATKIELQEDDGFFVNVGNLEVEESELTKEHYDPLEDIQKEKAKPVKVRKKPGPKPGFKRGQSNEKKTVITSPANKSVTSAGSKKSAASTAKKKLKTTATTAEGGSDKKTPSSPTKKGPTTKPTAQVKKLTKSENDKKKIMEGSYKLIVSLIGKEDLPRRKTKEKVALTCPADKKPGDAILFENPHVQGQRLKVKIPKTCKPGGTFRVTVPVPPAQNEDEGDHNKWTREFYMALSDYAYHYDDWMDAKTERMAAMGQEFPGHFEKRKKFDKMIAEFPKDLKTPIDKAYLQKILRRARQNKHKREKTAKIKQEGDPSGGKKSEPKKEDSAVVSPRKEPSSPTKKSEQGHTIISLPMAGNQFPRRSFNEADFS